MIEWLQSRSEGEPESACDALLLTMRSLLNNQGCICTLTEGGKHDEGERVTKDPFENTSDEHKQAAEEKVNTAEDPSSILSAD
jgi:hypothetical protein